MALKDVPSYRDHPRYGLRRFIILSEVLGMILSIPALSSYRHRDLSDNFIVVIFWFICSLIACVWDLVDWKLKATAALLKTQEASTERQPLLSSATTDDRSQNADSSDGDDKPDRPRVLLFILDLFLAIALCIMWTCTIATIQNSFLFGYLYYDGTWLMLLSSYASVTVLMSSLAHLICMWKELMAIKKTDWEQTLGRSRWEWEERLKAIVAAAVWPQRQQQTNQAEEHRACQHVCTCQAGSVGERVHEENKIVERIMRVLGKLVEEPDLLSREINDDPSTSIARRHDAYDIEAGPAYQHESLLTPSQSTSATEVDPDSPKTLRVGSESPSHPVLVAGESSSDTLEAVVVKKKGKKGGSAKGKEKASVQEQQAKQEQENNAD